jgi:hypothetical protein
VDGVSGAKLFL